MTFGAIGTGIATAAAGSLVSGAMSGGGGGGGGGQSNQSSNAPWANAQPWLVQNLNSGYGLQQRMEANPFSAQQLAAYNNQYAQSDYMRGLIPGLLGQLGGQQVGFDRSNPNARPEAWNWAGLLGGDGAPNLNQQSLLNAQLPPQAAPAAIEPEPSDFVNQRNRSVNARPMTERTLKLNPALSEGKYGSFKYGDPMPKPGTKAHQDMSLYFANGGEDPTNKYGRGTPAPREWWADGGGA